MWDSRPRLSGQMTAEGGCPTRKKLLNLLFGRVISQSFPFEVKEALAWYDEVLRDQMLSYLVRSEKGFSSLPVTCPSHRSRTGTCASAPP